MGYVHSIETVLCIQIPEVRTELSVRRNLAPADTIDVCKVIESDSGEYKRISCLELSFHPERKPSPVLAL